MASDFWASCDRFCHSNLCRLLLWIVIAGASVAGTVGTVVWALDQMARETKTVTQSNTAAIDALTAEVRDLGGITRQIGEDVAVLKDRTQVRATPRGPLVFAAPDQGSE